MQCTDTAITHIYEARAWRKKISLSVCLLCAISIHFASVPTSLVSRGTYTKENMKSPKCRTVLWYLVFFGMIVFITMLSNINIAIIAMVKEPRVIKPTDCGIVKAIANATSNVVVVVTENGGTKITATNYRFEWDEIEQSLILGAPFWLYSIVQIPAGILAQSYSAKLMFGVPHLLCAFLAFFVPLAAYHSFKAVFILRLLHGLFAGFTSPGRILLTLIRYQ